MAKEKFLLVSLKEDKAKKLAQIISNESCRSILDYLAEHHDSTEAELATKLQIPISTVHYNLKHLLAAGLVSSDEFHYSEKGKEVSHYKLANKYIIIAPKTTYGIKEKLKSIIPIGLITLATAAFIQFFLGKTGSFGAESFNAKIGMQEAMIDAAPRAALEKAEGAVAEATVAAGVPETVNIATAQATLNPALWFLFGCLFVIILVIIFELIKAKRQK